MSPQHSSSTTANLEVQNDFGFQSIFKSFAKSRSKVIQEAAHTTEKDKLGIKHFSVLTFSVDFILVLCSIFLMNYFKRGSFILETRYLKLWFLFTISWLLISAFFKKFSIQSYRNYQQGVTLLIKGPYTYGYLKAEIGIHRLVRISPFDAGGRRHTSFAAVFVYPEPEEEEEIDIKDEELKVETFRAGGAGGQHVNKTDSAVRLTHLATGIVVQCQNERSQHKNRSRALKILRARLLELRREEEEKKQSEIYREQKEIAWGNQIRSYVLQPYRMVKDHRTQYESGNVDAVLDGCLDPFMEAYLRKQ